MPPTSHPLIPEPRSTILKVVVSEQEKRHLQARAASERRSVSEYVRLRLPLGEQPATRSNPFGQPDQVTITRAA